MLRRKDKGHLKPMKRLGLFGTLIIGISVCILLKGAYATDFGKKIYGGNSVNSILNTNDNGTGSAVNDETGPIILWAYKDVEENCICIGLEDESGLDKITDEGGETRIKFEGAPTQVETKYNLKGQENSFKVLDIYGNSKTVNIDEITLNVNLAYRNANGDKIFLDVQDRVNGISKVTYTDGTDIQAQVENNLLDKKQYQVEAGTAEVLIYQGDQETFTRIELALDKYAPVVDGIYETEQGYNVIVTDKQMNIKAISYKDGDNEEQGINIGNDKMQETVVIPMSSNIITLKAQDIPGNEIRSKAHV